VGDQYVGEIRMFAGDYAPEQWLLCNGQVLPIAEYETLFTLIWTTYGGDGTTTFALPDLRGRIAIGQGQGQGQGAAHLTNRVLGTTGGAETVTLTTATMPAHTHSVSATNTLGTSASPTNNIWAQSAVKQYSSTTITETEKMASAALGSGGGSGGAHENMMPFVTINFIIATTGIYPSPA